MTLQTNGVCHTPKPGWLFGRASTFGAKNIGAILTVVVCVGFADTTTGGAISQEIKSSHDIALDFRFLRLGETRKAVIDLLGMPIAQAESRTLNVRYDRLTWIGPQGQKFVASFVFNRLWRWKTCSDTESGC